MSLNSVNRNVIRLAGMNSGLDTESIVSSMMQTTKNKVNKQLRTQYSLEWKQTAYKDLNNELRKLKEEYSTTLKQEQNMLSLYNYRSHTVKYQTASDSAYAGITAEPYANEGSYTIDSISQLAKASSVSSSQKMTGPAGDGLNLSWTMHQVNDAIKAAGGAGLPIENDQITFNLGGKDYTVSAYATLSSALSAINANSEDMTISYTQLTDEFTLSSKAQGANSTLSFEDNDFLTALGLRTENITAGQNAKLSVNGVQIERSSNNFSIDGVTFNLKKETEGQRINFEIERDLDKTVDLVKKYVESYNALITKLDALVTEKVERSYHPLVDEEKEAMSEKQIEQWEEKAKSGLLRNDGQLQTLISQLRMSFYNKVPGTNTIAADIGLGGVSTTVQSYSDAQKGILTIDEVKLRQSLQTNPDMVFQLFTARSESGDVDEMGVVTRINSLIDSYIKYNENETQYYNDQQITTAKNRYTEMLNAMYDEEERLWSRFTALETAMSNMNSQQSWISQQFSALSANK